MNETVEDYINMILRIMATEHQEERASIYMDYLDRMEYENMMLNYQRYDEDYI